MCTRVPPTADLPVRQCAYRHMTLQHKSTTEVVLNLTEHLNARGE